jgi:hypothetical protein
VFVLSDYIFRFGSVQAHAPRGRWGSRVGRMRRAQPWSPRAPIVPRCFGRASAGSNAVLRGLAATPANSRTSRERGVVSDRLAVDPPVADDPDTTWAIGFAGADDDPNADR